MSKIANFGHEFKKFAYKGNMVDLAIGFTVGAAFTAIAKSLVDDIVMPFVLLLMGGTSVEDFYVVLREGSEPAPYASLVDAQAVGAVTLNLGLFLNSILVFIIVALVMFFVVRAMIRLEHQLDELDKVEDAPEAPTARDCPHCLSSIPLGADRCPFCTSDIKPINSEGAPA